MWFQSLKIVLAFISLTTFANCGVLEKRKLILSKGKLVKKRLFLPVTIKGKIFHFLLDTGAATCTINQKIVKELNFKKIGSAQYAGASRVWKSADVVSATHFILGKKKFKSLKCISQPLRWDGILGIDVIGTASLYFDLKTGDFAFPYSFELPGKVIDFYVHKRVPDDILLKAKINGKEVKNLIFDTGGSTDLTDDLVRSLQLPRDPGYLNAKGQRVIETVISVDATGQESKTFYHRVDEICVSQFCKKDHKVMPAKYHSLVKKYKRNGMIGMDFFMGHQILLDFQKRKIVVGNQ